MEKYKIIVLLTCHENKDVVKDVIDNVFKFNDNACVIVNNGSSENMDDFNQPNVHIINRKPLNGGLFERFDTMVPLHLDMYECMLANNIQSDYVILLSSNQLFINRGLHEFMSDYDGSYYHRGVDGGCISYLRNHAAFARYYNEMSPMAFQYQSNHDGMFFKYDIFMSMMEYLKDFKSVKLTHHAEEFLYSAYLVKNQCKLVQFGEYNYWQTTWRESHTGIGVDEVQKCIDGGYYLVKRVTRELNDPARTYIRSIVLKD